VLVSLSLDPLSGAWYLMLLVTGGHVSLGTTLVWAALAGVLGSVVAITRSVRPEMDAREPVVSVRGPASYAGPGSLGGTESSLRDR